MTTDWTTWVPALLAFAISAALGPVVIPMIQKLKLSNTERALGVESHLKKQGTPTMGGLIFLPAMAIAGLVFIFKAPHIGPVLVLTVGFGLIGFLDDFLKVVKHNSDGLIAWQKLLLQIALILVFGIYVKHFTKIPTALRIPFTGGAEVEPGILFWPLLIFVIGGTVNGVNFTDGVDGLATSVTAVVACFFTAAAVILGEGAASFSSAVMGGLLGFLLYNAHPAKIFMGDTGSLALGGFVAGMAYVLGMPLYIPIIGLIYLVEVLSVILQVGYFKLTHGKRIFRMAPIHHHFEKGGWSETRVVAVFTVVTAICCIIGMMAI